MTVCVTSEYVFAQMVEVAAAEHTKFLSQLVINISFDF